ncbi:transient receptor potential cation channel subfamily A member 1-like isoform X1 [Hydra vulgaris]|uniref:Transient receptor potential cation channel subfamily A member 1-like isoform X1 n=1 Tax=Hydra vulgaris TaxID=6087 RepID=A0ABM4BKD8_HYDVU
MAKNALTVLFSCGGDAGKQLKITNNNINKYKPNQIFIDEFLGKKLPSSDVFFALHQAAIEGSLEKVKSILNSLDGYQRKMELISINSQGLTPLHLASKFNRVDIISFLLDNGSDINKKTIKEKNTALHFAAKYNMTDAAKCLCERNADVRLKNSQGLTALHFAARRGNEEICEHLIKHYCDVNAIDNEKCTPLHMAILSGSEAVTKLLIINHAHVYSKDSEGEEPIHYAAAVNQGELIILLTRGALATVKGENLENAQRKYVNRKTEKNDTALHIAARAGYIDTVKTLISIGASVNIHSGTKSTALHLAAINGDKYMTEYLLERNAKVNAYDHQNMTPAHKACKFGRFDVLKLLMENGAQIDSKDSNSFTPLLWAVFKGHNDIVEYLTIKGANVAVSEMNMKSVLHIAIENHHGSTLQVLLKHGGAALVNDPDKDFKRPLHYAAMINDVESIKMLIHESADIMATDNEEKTPLHTAAEYGHFKCLVTLVQNSSGNINGTDEKGRSPLHLAAYKGWVKTTNTLIEMGAQISSCDDSGWTPLDYAASYGHKKIVLKLINNGANVNRYDSNKTTPLHHASIKGNVDCIEALLNNGASISFKNKDGKNCLDLAVENNHKESCIIFIKNERWEEALSNIDNEGKSPMEKLIVFAPDIAAIVLDKCIKPSDHDKSSKDYNIIYDFKYLDFPPEQHLRKQYFGPSSMIAFNRENLLSHQLTIQLIKDKWSRLGRWIHLISLFIYIIFVSMLTRLLIVDKSSKAKSHNNDLDQIVMTAAIIFTVFELGKEVVQVYILKKDYFKDLSNYLEFILYSSALVYMISLIKKDDSEYTKNNKNVKWTAGAISILFAWINLLLYLKRNSFFGIYVIMIIEVFKSLMSVITVFCLIVLAFSLSFFMLFGNQKAFKYPGRAIMKTIAMTLGESSYDDIFINNSNATSNNNVIPSNVMLPYLVMSFILFTLFLIVCSIVILNLLVGLAVGNIADVRKSAYMLMLKAQVDILKALESKYPLQLLKKIYCSQVKVYPNKVSWKNRFYNWFSQSNYESLKLNQEKRSKWKKGVSNELEQQHTQFDLQKKRMQTMKSLMKENLEITKEVAVILKTEEKNKYKGSTG